MNGLLASRLGRSFSIAGAVGARFAERSGKVGDEAKAHDPRLAKAIEEENPRGADDWSDGLI
jgi:hypothetical protein